MAPAVPVAPAVRAAGRSSVRAAAGAVAATSSPRRPRRWTSRPPSRTDVVRINSGSTVKDVAEYLGVPVPEIIKQLMMMGEMVTLTQTLSDEAIGVLAEALEKEVEVVHADDAADDEPAFEDAAEDLVERPPVVTIMGHVDHGKTSLLDAIRQTNVVKGEAGGITQHIGAYQVSHDGRTITFLDTPGHEAFTAMRARGAKVTDVAVIVVAADDGVKPQTDEAIDHSKAAEVPILVAVNKIDKEGADPTRVRTELTQRGLQPAEWGGDTEFVDVSARTHENLEDLLETILVVTELEDLKANPNTDACGVVIESKLDPGRGPVVTVLDPARHAARRRRDRRRLALGQGPRDAGLHTARASRRPSPASRSRSSASTASPTPATRSAWSRTTAPPASRPTSAPSGCATRPRPAAPGARCPSTTSSRASRRAPSRSSTSCSRPTSPARSRPSRTRSPACRRARSRSTSCAAASAASASPTSCSPPRPTRSSSASTSARSATPAPSPSARAWRSARYSVIYNALDDLRDAMQGMLAPEEVEETVGTAEVRATFRASRIGTIAGCMVTDGTIRRGAKVRIVRDGTVVYDTTIDSLKRFNDDVREVATGFECGIVLANFQDVKEGDVLETYETRKVERALS